MTAAGLDRVLSALRSSSDLLAARLSSLSSEQAGWPSYDDGWSIGQVASHLGSQCEIFGLFLDAGERHSAAPGSDEMKPIWDRWNTKPPAQQAQDAVTTDTAFLDRVEAMDEADQADWRLDLFGREQDLAGLLRMRHAEHAVHTWDIAVTDDPAAGLADASVPLMLDDLASMVLGIGRYSGEPMTVRVVTSDPEQTFLLEVSPDEVRLTDHTDGPGDTATLELPAEAFVRLVYGRLDPDHTPESVRVHGADLDQLRRTFPGF